ncbi:MAG: pyridoxal-phosphate dependent enzyme [Pyrinomonadaceae bacterium]|nr:pyridoxal-phosphate dependent enzyme [Pyrinomonadaceae bacterium]
MNYHETVLSLIGNTPLVKINKLTAQHGIKAQIFAKMESLNPGYSVKDRIGVAMIEAAERDGTLKKGGTIVEATSGNTGIGLAVAAAVKGYKTIFIMTEKVSTEKVKYLKSLGSDVVICPVSAKKGTPDHYLTTARRIAAETPNSFYPDQFNNVPNREAHYKTTAPEIWRDTDGKITHFVAGAGTGGTISGVGRFLKEQNPNVQIIIADPLGSIFKQFKETGMMSEGSPFLVEGMGQTDMIPSTLDMRVVDDIINVPDRESFELSRQLSRQEGIFCGGSTGTNFGAALRVAKDLDETGLVVFIVCDTGEHYLTKHHSDEWMKEKLLLEPQRFTAGLLTDTKGLGSPRKLIFVEPSHTVGEALQMMNSNVVTQLPVLENGVSVGSLRESRVLAKLLENRELMNVAVSEIMDESFPVVGEETPLSEVSHELMQSPAVLVEEYKRIIGIITRTDVLEVPR